MSNPLLEDYLPATTDITAAAAADVRARLAALWLQADPDADVRPNTVIGDRILTPAAYTIAAVEEAMRRFMSDLDPDNVAQGIIWNCPFVSQFLGYFGVYALPEARGTGTVRLVFSSNAQIDLDRGLRFRTAAGEPELSLWLPNDGPMSLVRAAGQVPVDDSNTLRLVEIGRDLFAVDVPVTSEVTVTITAGTPLELTYIPDNLVSATCLDDFVDTAPPVALSKLAQLTRDTVYAASPGQIGGLRRFVRQMLPQIAYVSAAGPGDAEMLRGTTNALGLTTPAADVFVRGQNAGRLETQLVWLAYDQLALRFSGTWTPLQTPLLMRGVLWDGDSSLELDGVLIWGRSLDESKAPLMAAAGSGYDQYYVTLPMPQIDGTDAITLTSYTDSVGNTVHGAWFNVLYLSDPDVAVARSLLTSPDNRPMGVDVLVKPPVIVEFSNIDISYRRRAGQSLNLTAAQLEIQTHINNCGWPDRMTPAPWIDSMYYAGAASVSILAVGQVRWSVADRWLNAGAPTPDDDYAGAYIASFTPPELLVNLEAFDGLSPEAAYTDSWVACGFHNLGWYAEAANISFTEL